MRESFFFLFPQFYRSFVLPGYWDLEISSDGMERGELEKIRVDYSVNISETSDFNQKFKEINFWEHKIEHKKSPHMFFQVPPFTR